MGGAGVGISLIQTIGAEEGRDDVFAVMIAYRMMMRMQMMEI